MKALRPVIASNGIPSLEVRPVGSHCCASVREKEGEQKRTGGLKII
jgi:hypothetical protein